MQVGDYNTQYNNVLRAPLPAMETVPALPGLSQLPPETGLFVGRSGELEQLEKALSVSGRAAVVAVHGLGGVGKSTLAAQFAHLNAARFEFRWWVTADSPAAIDGGLAELAVALLPAVIDLPVEERIALGVRWLATHDKWLLVLDNLTAPTHAAPLLERVRSGTIIITSRQSTGWRDLTAVPLDVLAPGEALGLLERIVQVEWPEANLAEGERLCAELGWLPLAVEQAAAYIAQTRITPARYLDLLAQLPARMFTATAEGGDAQRTIGRVWRVTLDHLVSTPSAGQLLRVLAWYASDEIPRGLLDDIFTEPDLLDAVGRLAAYSMINLTADTIGVHRLVQAVTRTPDDADPHRHPEDIAAACVVATTALNDAVDELDHRTPSSWPGYRAIQPHARALFDRTAPDVDTEDMSVLLIKMGVYLDSQGDTASAIAYLTRAAQGSERRHDSDQSTTLGAFTNLANAYLAAGDLDRAIPLIESTLAKTLIEYGSDDRSTQVLRNNLANAYKSAGDLERAIPLLEAAVADRERLWGLDHPDTLVARNNLANAYRDARDFSRAIELHASVVADRTRVLGADHPATLNSRHNLAHGYLGIGDAEKAKALYIPIVSDRIRVLGPDHRDTLGSQHNLANTFRLEGDFMRAIRLHKSVLSRYIETLGADHPDALNARVSIANTYRSAGNLAQAIRWYESAAAEHVRVLGDDHLDALRSQVSLADAYKEKGNLERAIQLYESISKKIGSVLGLVHPETVYARSGLVAACASMGDLKRGVTLSEAIVADCARLLGATHVRTLTTQNNLATAYATIGDRKRAIALLKSVDADCSRVLGSGHPTTTDVRKNLEAVLKADPRTAPSPPALKSRHLA
ncbi:FxSxx-COOH system tetratricopeptide repeat protein [Amycolatopsis sp. NPDC023774]|uniref:FxSxx-COOH system tetratricopeptide repeat protein n=1 Tax=Amycolatopsis sp. NPDC023774 TaxID=3155015 RepID=UPI0033FE89B0